VFLQVGVGIRTWVGVLVEITSCRSALGCGRGKLVDSSKNLRGCPSLLSTRIAAHFVENGSLPFHKARAKQSRCLSSKSPRFCRPRAPAVGARGAGAWCENSRRHQFAIVPSRTVPPLAPLSTLPHFSTRFFVARGQHPDDHLRSFVLSIAFFCFCCVCTY